MLNEKQFPGYSAAHASMYESMSDNQLRAVHSQSKFILEHGKSPDKSKHETRLKYTTPLMEQRKLSDYESMPESGKREKTYYGDKGTPKFASDSGKPDPNIRYS